MASSETQTQANFTFNPAMIVPILGWLYIAVGLIWTLPHWSLIWIWWIDVFLSVVVHTAQIVIALPVAKYHGFSPLQASLYTFIFGATWWRPLQVKMANQD